MKKLLALLLITSLTALCQVTVKTGLEVLRDSGFKVLEGKNVGLITNPTGVDAYLRSTVDIFFEQKNFKLIALYGPEHGVRGDFAAGDHVGNDTDKVTGLPVFSLYGENRKPKKEMLAGIDILVYDIQDIGCRSYTYISTLGMVMEAAAENNIPVIVLDRPNPLGGNRIEGNIAEPAYFSFVSQFPIPYVYGLTCGELAKFLNAEKILKNGVQCELTIIPLHGWKRDMTFEETGLPWVPTSPHVPHAYSPYYYVASGVIGELGVFNEGVGYTIPFQAFGAEWMNAAQLADRMNSLHLPGVIFRPMSYKPFYGGSNNKNLQGVQIHITDYKSVSLMGIQFAFLKIHSEMYPDKKPFLLCEKSRISMFDKVCGSKNVRAIIDNGFNMKELNDFLNKDVQKFREISSKYFLY